MITDGQIRLHIRNKMSKGKNQEAAAVSISRQCSRENHILSTRRTLPPHEQDGGPKQYKVRNVHRDRHPSGFRPRSRNHPVRQGTVQVKLLIALHSNPAVIMMNSRWRFHHFRQYRPRKERIEGRESCISWPSHSPLDSRTCT